MKSKLVSVIVPVYNVMPYLKECLESIINQTYRKLEIILIDDGSFDGSENICDDYAKNDARIIVIHQENKGVVRARNVGLDIAAGEFVLFIDADDVMDLTMIEYMINHIKDCDFLSIGMIQEHKNQKEVLRHDKFPEGIYRKDDMKEILCKMFCFEDRSNYLYFTPNVFNKLYKTSFLRTTCEKVSEDLTYAEDMVLNCIYVLNCSSMAIMHRPLYRYRYRENSAVHHVAKNRLIEINKAYLALYQVLYESEFKNILLPQLERWVTMRTFRAINYDMGFSAMSGFSEFQIDPTELEGKKVVLYGAGKVGCCYAKQLRASNVILTAWIDKRFEELRNAGMDVDDIEKINHIEYDLILVAANDEELAREMFQFLQSQGVDREKLVWKKPERIIY